MLKHVAVAVGSIVTVALMVAVFRPALSAIFPGMGPKQEVAVECAAAGPVLASGMACSLQHKSGDESVSACWSINIACTNGSHGTAKGCGTVAPKSKSTALVPFSAFGGALDTCDQTASASVTDLVAQR